MMKLGPSQETQLPYLLGLARRETVTRNGAFFLAGNRGTGKTTILAEASRRSAIAMVSSVRVLRDNLPSLGTPIELSGANLGRLLISSVRSITDDRTGAVVVDTLPIISLLEANWTLSARTTIENCREFLHVLARAYTLYQPLIVEINFTRSMTWELIREVIAADRLALLEFTADDSRKAYWSYNLSGSGLDAEAFRSYYDVLAVCTAMQGEANPHEDAF